MTNFIETSWALRKDHFTEEDRLWCYGLGVKFTAEPIFNNVYSYGKLISQDIKSWSIRLQTVTEKQEVMLKLKYGSNLLEISKSYH